MNDVKFPQRKVLVTDYSHRWRNTLILGPENFQNVPGIHRASSDTFVSVVLEGWLVPSPHRKKSSLSRPYNICSQEKNWDRGKQSGVRNINGPELGRMRRIRKQTRKILATRLYFFARCIADQIHDSFKICLLPYTKMMQCIIHSFTKISKGQCLSW